MRSAESPKEYLIILQSGLNTKTGMVTEEKATSKIKKR